MLVAIPSATEGCSQPTLPPPPHLSSPAAPQAVGMLPAPNTSVGDELCQGGVTSPRVPQAQPVAPSPAPAARLVPCPLHRRVQSHGRLRLASRPELVPQPSSGSSWPRGWRSRWRRVPAPRGSARSPPRAARACPGTSCREQLPSAGRAAARHWHTVNRRNFYFLTKVKGINRW